MKYSTKFKSALFNRKGNTVVMATLVMAAVSLSGISMLQVSSSEQTRSMMDVSTHKAKYIAHAGLSQAKENLFIGNSPDKAMMAVYDGSMEVVSDPASRTITSYGYFEDAKVEYSMSSLFSADCFAINFSSANYKINIGPHEWSKLTAVTARKTCTEIDKVQIKEMRVLYGAPVSSRMVKHIDINGTDFLYHVPDATVGYEYPSGMPVGNPFSGAKSKDLIDTDVYTFGDNSTRDMSVFWNHSFSSTAMRIEVVFEDGSIYTSPVHVLN